MTKGNEIVTLVNQWQENIMTKANEILTLVNRLRPILAGHDPNVQGGALADCVALWLAGHHVDGNEDETRTLRAELLAMHCSMVRQLVPLNANELGTTP